MMSSPKKKRQISCGFFCLKHFLFGILVWDSQISLFGILFETFFLLRSRNLFEPLKEELSIHTSLRTFTETPGFLVGIVG